MASGTQMNNSNDIPPPLRLAVIGAGYWGPNIIRNFFDNRECDLVAVCDRDTKRLSQLPAQIQRQVTLLDDASRVFEDPTIDAVAIVTDIDSHRVLAEAALKAGKHVFVEKPLATSAEDCLFLGKLVQQVKKHLMVGHTFIYNPAVAHLKQTISKPDFGETLYLHAQRLNLGRLQVRVNALWSLAVHDVAIALELFDELPSSVSATGHAYILPGVEDVTFVSLHFPSGRMAHIHTSWLDPQKRRQVTVVGSRQMVVYDDVSLDQKIVIYDKGIDKVLKDASKPEFQNFSEFQYLIRTGDMHIPHISFTEPLKVETQHFIDCALGRHSRPKTGWEEGCQVVSVLEAAQSSLQKGGIPVEIQYLLGEKVS